MQLEGLVIPVSFSLGMLSKGVDIITDLIGDAVSATFEWADGMDKLGDVTGMTNEQTAAWAFTAQKAGVSVDTLANSTVILQKGLFDSKGELSTTGKALEDFGVSIMDASGNVKDQNALMGDIAAKYAEFGTQTERVDFLTNVFGKSGANLVDVFDTLAQEGGIDAVEQKVKDLGLAIDPAQYEQFGRGIKEIGLTFTGLANTLIGPLVPALGSLVGTFTQWLQEPWIAEQLKNVGENLGKLADDIALGVSTGNWDAFFADFEAFTGINIEPVITEMQKFSDWLTNVGIPKFNEFIAAGKLGFADFQASSTAETSAIQADWALLMDSIQNRITILFGPDATMPMINWKQIGITALQAIDLGIKGLTAAMNAFNSATKKAIDLMQTLGESSTDGASIGFGSMGGKATGGPASGLTMVGENGPELVNLPSGSYVNHNQASNRMGSQPVQAYIDYDELARVLGRVFGQQMQRA